MTRIMIIVALMLTMVAAGCGEAGSSGGVCPCTADEHCEEGFHCERCACLVDCTGPEDCPDPNFPNCDPETGRCVGPCASNADCPDPAYPNCGPDGVCMPPCETNDDCTHPDYPNCGADGICFGACAGPSDCTHPDYPNCDPQTGLCFGPCDDNSDCPPQYPNCDPLTGLCNAPCTDNSDCPPGAPNCNTQTGICFGPCQTNADCQDPSYPNCDPTSGICFEPCNDNPDCTSTWPNCKGSGLCEGACTDHADCTLPARPNCQMDPDLADLGICLGPCTVNADCLDPNYPSSPDFPNCDPTPGRCLPPCTDDGDCPSEFRKCDTGTGLCFDPECELDSECNPPATVCENWFCVPGCTQHSDCAAVDRCDLITPGHLYHCEPRDCFTDADCNAPTTVCDTDGLVDPDGGGYCEPGCQTYYDCRQLGYDCNTGTGGCEVHDYGDIGNGCGGGCDSGFCLSGMGNVCTGFCCVQHDCPDGWGCRQYDDGTGGGHTVDVCVTLDATHGMSRHNDPCTTDTDCRSGICGWDPRVCRETCCSHGDCNQPFLPNQECRLWTGGITACVTQDTTGIAPLGAVGCSTAGSPSMCRSNMCFSYINNDTGCVNNGDCTVAYPNCDDYWNDGTNDCIHDMCVDHCCTYLDCPDYGADSFYCGKVRYPIGDYNVCLWHTGAATQAEGQACASPGACRSRFCSSTDNICRKRCCTDLDCTNPTYPRCALEFHLTVNGNRWVNVCQPP